MIKIYKEIDSNGAIRWFKEGTRILHNDDGPAVEYKSGDKVWYKEGDLHREDGPACECTDGTKFWYKKDKLHRENGPAADYANGRKQYWYEGIRYDVSNLDEFYIKRILE